MVRTVDSGRMTLMRLAIGLGLIIFYPHYIHTAYVCYSERRPHGSFGRPRPFPISGSYGRANERLAGLAGGSACPTLLAKDLQALGACAFDFQPGSREGRACPTPTPAAVRISRRRREIGRAS